ncbi:hypothetical protein V6N12_020338 [Hibiscus sabdariffa]|uniref:Uncharacterized protein n=1 Tax=Hibiscus sabdariffa TaxID=183260 RepID=A0ABR2B1L7_9ROSI
MSQYIFNFFGHRSNPPIGLRKLLVLGNETHVHIIKLNVIGGNLLVTTRASCLNINQHRVHLFTSFVERELQPTHSQDCFSRQHGSLRIACPIEDRRNLNVLLNRLGSLLDWTPSRMKKKMKALHLRLAATPEEDLEELLPENTSRLRGSVANQTLTLANSLFNNRRGLQNFLGSILVDLSAQVLLLIDLHSHAFATSERPRAAGATPTCHQLVAIFLFIPLEHLG